MSITINQSITIPGHRTSLAAVACLALFLSAPLNAADQSNGSTDSIQKSDDAAAVEGGDASAESESAEDEAQSSGPVEPAPADSANESTDGKRALSVAPLSHAEYPEDRPAWIEAAPDLDGEVVVWPVKSSLCGSEQEAKENLDAQIRGAVAAYVELVLGEERAAEFDIPSFAEIPLESLAREDRYNGQATRGQEVVYEAAARLRFDERYRRRLNQHWKESAVGARLEAVGVASALGFAILLAGSGLTRRIARKRTGAAI